MSWITDDHRCTACSTVYDVLKRRSERDEPSECPSCGGSGGRIPSAPLPLRRSYHMGKDRGDGWNKMKEAAKLEKEAANLAPDKRKEIASTINDLRKVKK